MELYKGLMTRRSVRQFSDKPVKKSVIQDVLKAAMHAPSSCNSQPWSFIVITEKSDLLLLSKKHPYTKMAKDAAFAVLLLGEERKLTFKEFFPQDLAACANTMLLAAHAKKIGGVWCGIYPNPKYMKTFDDLFHLKKDFTPFALLCFGYPTKKLAKINRYEKKRVAYL